MTRPTLRRTLRLENLESRQLLTAGGPTSQQQYMLELLNLARTNPAAIADKVTSNLDFNVQATIKHYKVDLNQVKAAISSAPVKPPLAWNSKLANAAQDHSQDQANTGVQSHDGSDGSTVPDRLDRAGYGNRTTAGENAFAYSTSVDEAMEAFMIDWGVDSAGHRNNILQPETPKDNAYRDVGIGIVNTKSPSPVGPIVITQNFGAQAGAKAQLLGVAYNDPSGKDFYEPGQGRGDVTVEAVNDATGQKASVQTWDSGGYQIPLDPGNYTVTARVGDKVVRSQDVKIDDVNVKVDYDLNDPWQLTPPVTKTPPAPVAAPATPPPAEVPKTMIQSTTSAPVQTAPVDAPKTDSTPVVLKAEPVKSEAAVPSQPKSAPVTPVAAVPSKSEVVQAATQPDHSPVAPPTPDTSFFANWVSWKAKKSAA
ncbi:CAP domain-containing protein [Singulisphaera acidiphila]|uniref:Cysteine-rich secretory protein family n=1 Tax=Singulisphaera acidiphila (strain ATCC BAA-1392 / DSM 18658 / VKM B-2454 / MOB10) TaxID=886293 RepID=L0DL39_SINAD|nr:CAP domain-containing protein [Singulisphaera acidiphila]AGA29952.1 Cysteine-rich secretory protein family [Singulisphaera acidiphila DSM 18658]